MLPTSAAAAAHWPAPCVSPCSPSFGVFREFNGNQAALGAQVGCLCLAAQHFASPKPFPSG